MSLHIYTPRTHHYSKIGIRCYASNDWTAKERKNMIDVLYESSVIGCGIIEHNVDADVFNSWVEKILLTDLLLRFFTKI